MKNQIIAAEAGVGYDSRDSDNSGIQEHCLARSNYTTVSVQGDVQRKLYPKNALFTSENPVIKADIATFLLFLSSHSISLTQQGFVFYSIATNVCYDKYTP